MRTFITTQTGADIWYLSNWHIYLIIVILFLCVTFLLTIYHLNTKFRAFIRAVNSVIETYDTFKKTCILGSTPVTQVC